MKSITHIIDTLKSTNDTFLSDWKGVIGTEIEQQQQTEAQIIELSKNIEDMLEVRDIVIENKKNK